MDATGQVVELLAVPASRERTGCRTSESDNFEQAVAVMASTELNARRHTSMRHPTQYFHDPQFSTALTLALDR